ncbi:hypothetical protein SHI21_16330 [Bacteriovorax sp. PP10]|uniref:Uncharacterized protein n=1 Tax=Bacteriovorax antarcticus TaxID=3088717 RepID=A0ABU5W0K6_9BACT|nr:hypothetical protein [Bacteriovorax sp. PP10]MEA9357800.1 hypothetical protein [Bacteriovorax sp. PP10]
MKYPFLIAATLLLISSVNAAENTEWTCLSADKSVSLVINHEESSYTAQGLVTVANIRVPMPCQVTGAAFMCLENTDQAERLGAAIGATAEGQFSGYVYIHNKVNGFQKFADITCTKTK